MKVHSVASFDAALALFACLYLWSTDTENKNKRGPLSISLNETLNRNSHRRGTNPYLGKFKDFKYLRKYC